MVLTGYDGIAAGKEQGVWVQVMPKYKVGLPEDRWTPTSRAPRTAYNLFDGYGIAYVFCPGGPMFTYNPDKVTNPPKTAADLLAWAKANPGKFLYARPANSGPGPRVPPGTSVHPRRLESRRTLPPGPRPGRT